jgi:hypothetical protein
MSTDKQGADPRDPTCNEKTSNSARLIFDGRPKIIVQDDGKCYQIEPPDFCFLLLKRLINSQT